jgi:enoyl-CoA hydratase/carnithine racemase
MAALSVRAGEGLVAACQGWLEALPYPTAVLIHEVEGCREPAEALAVGALPMPVIGHANGAIRDAALELWLACDIRIAGPDASFGVSAGYAPSAGLTYRLPRAIGRGAALDVLLVREQLDAGDALRLGLATRLGSEDDAEAVLRRLLDGPPIAARFAKEAVRRGQELTLEQGLRLETDLYALLQTTADRSEGLAAWREKRPPRFSGY